MICQSPKSASTLRVTVFLAQLLPFGDAAALEAFGEFERAVYSA